MTPALTPDEITVLREAIYTRRAYLAGVSDFLSRETQGTAQARSLVAVGHRQRALDAVDQRLRDFYAAATGMPTIHHGNTDIADCSSPAWPMTPDAEAREANLRG